MECTVNTSCSPGARTPQYMSADSAGADLTAYLGADVEIAPGDRVLIPTGIRIAIPRGYEGQVRPRSGLALRHGITLLNSPGTIDSDYRGEVAVILVNLGREPYRVKHGDRIAQLVIAPVQRGKFELVDTLDDTSRGTEGFGSTGVGARELDGHA